MSALGLSSALAIALMNCWKVQINAAKSVKVNCALRPHPTAPSHISDVEVPTQEHAKFIFGSKFEINGVLKQYYNSYIEMKDFWK